MSRQEMNKVVKAEEPVGSSHCSTGARLSTPAGLGVSWVTLMADGQGGSWEDDQAQEDLAGDGGRRLGEAEAGDEVGVKRRQSREISVPLKSGCRRSFSGP